MGEETGNEENRDLFSFDFVDKTTKGNYNKIMSEEQKRNSEPEESTRPGSSDETGTKLGTEFPRHTTVEKHDPHMGSAYRKAQRYPEAAAHYPFADIPRGVALESGYQFYFHVRFTGDLEEIHSLVRFRTV